MFNCWQINLQSDCRSTHSVGLESAPAGVPEVSVVSAGILVGTEVGMLLSGGAAGALTEVGVPGIVSTGDASTLLTPLAGADAAEVASVDPRLLVADGLVPLPSEFGPPEEVTDGERVVCGA